MGALTALRSRSHKGATGKPQAPPPGTKEAKISACIHCSARDTRTSSHSRPLAAWAVSGWYPAGLLALQLNLILKPLLPHHSSTINMSLSSTASARSLLCARRVASSAHRPCAPITALLALSLRSTAVMDPPVPLVDRPFAISPSVSTALAATSGGSAQCRVMNLAPV